MHNNVETWQLAQSQTDLLQVNGRHTADTIMEAMHNLCKEWDVGMSEDCKVFLTADRGTNVVAAVRESGQMWHIPCLQHVLHRAILTALDAKGQKVYSKS